MHKFIVQLIKHLLLTLSLFSLYILIFDKFFNSHDKSKLFNNDIVTTKTILTGTSHTLWGLDPKLFTFRTINISEINKPIIIDLEIIKKYHKKTPNLEYVIIPVDYFTLFYTGDCDAFAKKYWHHWGLKNKDSHLFHFVDCKIATPIDLFTKKNPELSNFVKQKGVYNSIKHRANMLRRINAWHNNWMNLKNYILIKSEILQFITFCKSQNIKIIFVQMPIPISTRNKFSLEYTKVTNNSLQLFSNYSNAYVIDFLDFSVFNNDSLYSDCDHLNFKGAKLASSILNDKILAIASKTNEKDSIKN